MCTDNNCPVHDPVQCRKEFERQGKEQEAEFAKHDKLRKKREATFECIVAEATLVLTAVQLRVLLRALVNLDSYTFADDLTADISENSKSEERDNRTNEGGLLTAIDGTTDDKLTSFAAHLALTGHRAIPRDGELGSLSEAEAAFLTPKPKKSAAKNAPNAKKSEPYSGSPHPSSRFFQHAPPGACAEAVLSSNSSLSPEVPQSQVIGTDRYASQ